MIKTYFHQQELAYTGKELHSHFALSKFNIIGDSLVAFVGPCSISGDDLVDMEEALSGQTIYSPKMLHFIAEFFGMDIHRAVLWQRLLVSIAMSSVIEQKKRIHIERYGDDLYIGDKKLSISVATVSPVSALVHLGMNIDVTGVNFPIIGLQELNMHPEGLALFILEAFAREVEGARLAISKVRGVN